MHLKRRFRRYWKDSAGFALFLAWVYCTLFGCGLATSHPELAGLPTDWGLERIWLWAGAAEAIGGIALVTLASKRFAGSIRPTWPVRQANVLAAACGILGTVAVWAAWLERTVWFDRLHGVGGVLVGMGIALLTTAWGRRLGSFDEARIEFVVPLGFALSFALYLALLCLTHGSAVDLALVAAMCLGSALFLQAGHNKAQAGGTDGPRAAAGGEGAGGRTGDEGSSPLSPITASASYVARHAADTQAARHARRRGLASFAACVCASWVQLAFFRVISSPALLGDRFAHYLYPFLMACVVSCVLFLLCLRVSRYLNASLAYRWGMPLFVISYVPLFVDYGNDTLRMLAYAVNFLGMFGVQFGCWLGAAKYVRRTGANPVSVFGCYALAEGLGVLAGCFAGLFAASTLEATRLLTVSVLLLGGVQLVVMASGFNPQWVFRRTRGLDPERPVVDALVVVGGAKGTGQGGTEPCKATAREESAPAPSATTASTAASITELFQQEALRLQEEYALTHRETEVTALLLAGRSRPFIRDELLVSLNTVGVHVRNIFGKCGVHSQQELINLAREMDERGAGRDRSAR